jgi:hypothetical protein
MLIEVAVLLGASLAKDYTQAQQIRKSLAGDWSEYRVPEDQVSDTDNP